MPQKPLSADLDHILDHTADQWDEVRGERLFITGGTGFFGCWLLESFLWANQRLNLGAQAVVLTRSPQAFQQKAPHLANSSSIHLLQGDIRAFVFPSGRFSHVIHAATDASASLNEENPLLMLDTITEGTRRALDFAKICGAKKFLLTSSGAVYGKQPSDQTHVSEDYRGALDPLDPRSAYGEGKRLAEHLCALYAQQSAIEMKIVRCFAFVGPYLPLDIHYAIGNFIRDGLNGGPIIIRGNGTPYRSYLYAADLAIWIWKILFYGESCRAYNVGSEESLTIAQVAQLVADCFSPKVEVLIKGTRDLNGAPERYVPSTARAKNELQLESMISPQDAVARTIHYYRGLRR
ncbi:MAG: NAD-dependent epimerase/dehydratase family protein [Anaerolineae bacterium]|nr:NAD-dependent epimerase/dehydratase family protein [Anaerolineae bacterium]